MVGGVRREGRQMAIRVHGLPIQGDERTVQPHHGGRPTFVAPSVASSVQMNVHQLQFRYRLPEPIQVASVDCAIALVCFVQD